MNQRISKIRTKSIGSLPCEQSLNNILVELNDASITNKTMRRYFYFKEGLKKLKPLQSDKIFYNLMLDLWKKENLQKWKSTALNTNVPQKVYTYLCCCINAQYRLAK